MEFFSSFSTTTFTVDTVSLRKYATSTIPMTRRCPMLANPEDLTSADALFREYLSQLKPLVKSQRSRVEAFAHGKPPQKDDELAMFIKKAKADPKEFMVDLSLQQFAAAQAFAILLSENNRLLLELMNRGSKK